MTPEDPSPERSEHSARATEDRYRAEVNVEWDRVAVGSHCVDCFPGNCPLHVFVKDGKVVREELAGTLEAVEEGVPDMNPMGCQKGVSWSRQLYSEDRIMYPMRRAGERGEGKWERITWTEAFREIADAVIDAIEETGPESIVHEGSPEIGAIVAPNRFIRTVGGTVLDVNASINDFWPGLHQVLGKFYIAPSVDDIFHADLILIWHSNPAYTYIPSYHYLTEARYRGAESVLFAPDASPSHVHADYYIPVKHGSDAALALAMAQVIIEEELADLDFVRQQTDLSLLVNKETGCFLRPSDLGGGGSDRFFQHDPKRGAIEADMGTLKLDFEPALTGEVEVENSAGEMIAAEPLFARLRRHLDDNYRPEAVAEAVGAHPEAIREIARKIASRKTRVIFGAGATKYFHGDLITRAIMLVLGLTGNWGKKGTGITGWATGLFDGHTIGMAKQAPGVEGAEAVINALEGSIAQLRKADPSLTDELAGITLWRAMAAQSGMAPPFFFWYWHAGYKDRWERDDWQPEMERSFSDYFEEARKWWGQNASPGPESPPRVLFEVAGNMLRRSRGGQELLLESLWPQLDKIICVDYRMSQTALYSDIVLPATQHYEKVTFGMPTPWTMFLGITDAAAPPPGEARSEWEMFAALCRAIGERAAERGLEKFSNRFGAPFVYGDLYDAFTLGGSLPDDESVADEMVRDSVLAGSLPPGTSLATLREKGWTRYEDWGLMMMAKGQASPFPRNETHAPMRNHIELGHPYPTLTRRAQFLIDHPWYVEAGEDLPVHKEPPPMGGDYPFKLSSGHNRWSVHAMNTTNDVVLQTHRGKPFVLMNEGDALAVGVEDDALVRIFNDAGDFVVPVRTSPAQAPGGLTVYNGFEGFMFPGGKGPNEVEPGLVKWLQMVSGYGHLAYAPTEWQPVPTDRCVFVGCEPA
ncbi:MAG: hypothetical protein DCC49_12410 [Acidobacteria bacterium]|nr:MAG: hypothetical protein DCC49_12410 [Acidobacteriota bacterium]